MPFPAYRYRRFLPTIEETNLLDFGLKETPLVEVKKLAKWLGVKKCFLKLESHNPTGTVKDRITELTFAYFKQNGITSYSHTSTGNTGTSLVWGLRQYAKDFKLHFFIPEEQYGHYNFQDHHDVSTTILGSATYDEAKAYNKWYSRTHLGLPEILSYTSNFRQEANKVPFLESFEQLSELNESPDFVCQTISSGTGLIGAHMAAQDAKKEGWIKKEPFIGIIQPKNANPIVACLREGNIEYDEKYSLAKPRKSQAWAIRRGNAKGCYKKIHDIVYSTNGFAQDATESEIIEAKSKLYELESIDAGYTACTALAGIKKESISNQRLKEGTVLVMITGLDRATDIAPDIDEIVPEETWKKVVKDNA